MDGPLGAVADRVRGRDGTAWTGSAEDLLFDGERIRERVDVGGGHVVVTTHRLLAVTPDADGENYRWVDLPNVEAVAAGHDGEGPLLVRGGRAFVYGVVLLAVGLLVDFGSVIPTELFGRTGAAGRMGMSGLLGSLNAFTRLVARADEFARLAGAALLLVAVFVFAVYLFTRDRVVVVSVAGDDDVTVPAPDDPAAAVADLERALFGADAAGTVERPDSGGGETPGVGGGSPDSSAGGTGSGDRRGSDADPLDPGTG